jgi:glycosyltransferase involved in cell wall biosynthesis
MLTSVEKIRLMRPVQMVNSEILCVVIPAYKVRNQILGVLAGIDSNVHHIIVIDDSCPEKSGHTVIENSNDTRVEVLFHNENRGVGAAVITGYERALDLGATVIVKIDGDGQMDPRNVNLLITPIIDGNASYSKGNRFTTPEGLRKMPLIRIWGNLALSFMTKFSSGYWNIFDPTNGFTAIKAETVKSIPLAKIDNRYFFESDLLFRLNLVGAIVKDVPLPAFYGTEKSNLKIIPVLFEFPRKHLRNYCKRIFYKYYLLDFNLASIELPLGLVLFCYGIFLGLTNWIASITTNIPTKISTLFVVSLSILTGLQFLLAFLSDDMRKKNE